LLGRIALGIRQARDSSDMHTVCQVSWQVELIVPVAIGLRSRVLTGVGIGEHKVAVFDIGSAVFSPGNVSEFN